MTTAKDVLKTIKDKDVKYVDLRFTDPRGKWQHVTFDVAMVDEDIFADGTMFDGSSIAGWKAINESDMMLMPDPTTADDRSVLRRRPRMVDLLRRARADHRRALQPRPARASPRRPRPIVKSTGIGDTVFSARKPSSSSSTTCASPPTPTTPASSSTPSKLPTNTDTDYESGNLGHRIAHQGRLLPGAAASTSAQDMRARDAGGHGRDGRQGREAPPRGGLRPARARHEVRHADADGRPHADLQVRASTTSRTAYGKTATFMPKPIYGDNGSGMHVPPVDLEGRQAAVRRQQVRRPVGDVPLLHRRHHQARQGDQRLHQPDDQLLQAPGAGLRGAGAARLLGAQPLGLVPHPVRRHPEGQARRGPLPRSDGAIPISPSRRC